VNPYAGFAWDPVNLRDPTGEKIVFRGFVSQEDTVDRVLGAWALISGLSLRVCRSSGCEYGSVQANYGAFHSNFGFLGSRLAREILIDAINDPDTIAIDNYRGSPNVELAETLRPGGSLDRETGEITLPDTAFRPGRASVPNLSSYNFEAGRIALDISDFGDQRGDSSDIDFSFGVGFVLLHELMHRAGLADIGESESCPGLGSVVPVINRIRAQLGLPTRENYCVEKLEEHDGRYDKFLRFSTGRLLIDSEGAAEDRRHNATEDLP